MSVSGVSTPAAYVPTPASQAAPLPPPSTKVDSDGDRDGDKGGSRARLLDVKA